MPWKNDQVTEKETKIIIEATKNALNAKEKGDFVEFGCYKGDTSLLLAELLRDYNSLKNQQLIAPLSNSFNSSLKTDPIRLWLYDSFEGLPEKTINDEISKSPEFKKGVLSVSKREVKVRFLHANLPVPVIKKAWFEDLTSSDIPDKIAFAFLDGDLYNSIKTSLNLIYKNLTPSAKIIIHDYTNEKLPGVKKATDEFFENHSLLSTQTLIKL